MYAGRARKGDNLDIISSNKNDKLRNVVSLLKTKKIRTEQGAFVIEGIRIARDAFKSAFGLISQIFVSESFMEKELWKEHEEFLARNFKELPNLYIVKDSVFESLSETVTPQGILCVVKQPSYEYGDIVSGSGALKLLVLEDIQDPGNLGTMIRTAEAAGMNGVIMSKGTVDIFSPKVTRSTMGAIFRVPFMYTDDLCGVLDRLKSDGVRVSAAYLRNGEDYAEADYSPRAAVMIGNEGNGLSDEAVSHASQNVFIPMQGEVESLNAAIAAALLMYRI